MRSVDDASLTERTIFIVTSDHGDMDMVSALCDLSLALHTILFISSTQEQQQFYKIVPAGLGVVYTQFEQATSLIDL